MTKNLKSLFRTYDPADRPVVIAEAGVNHNGDISRALQLIDVAADCGADVVKFQAFRSDTLIADDTPTARYQAANTGQNDQSALLAELELSAEDFRVLAQHCKKRQIGFLCTPFDVQMTEFLVSLGMPAIKVASGELTNDPALVSFARFDLPVILSTGMASKDEVAHAISVLKSAGVTDITVLQCTSLYPAPPETLNLRAIHTMRECFGLPTGFSDHSLGDHASIAAAALGAVVIEKHFTLDRNLPGPDHLASLEPDELAAMMDKLAAVAAGLGDGVKKPHLKEQETAALVRRSWHLARDVAEGAVLQQDDVVLLRPDDGIPPSRDVVGLRTTAALKAGDALLPSHVS